MNDIHKQLDEHIKKYCIGTPRFLEKWFCVSYDTYGKGWFMSIGKSYSAGDTFKEALENLYYGIKYELKSKTKNS